ncbi:EF-hand calcium-binding domain-containing protein 6 isoform X2 [Stegostoma tigrinum]|uniref:EF-hand calcium-binding domain-containing protein 6 isoform X2 n=1 Tax=Stegostoma tigrinum TaxID=3053191 RepID=UPI00202B52E3|nr:EF-hand calcium-binding domain-containing protein 6 isoform X2 [Stegostoma tigrinum]
MVGSSPDLGALCLESHGMPLTPRPQSTPGRSSSRNFSRGSLQSSSGTLFSESDLRYSITKIEHILAERAKERESDLRRAFYAYDVLRNLTVTKDEFRKVIEKFLLPLNPKQFQDLLARLPINSDETVPYNVFLDQFCTSDGSQVRSAVSRNSSVMSKCDMTVKEIENHLREKISNNLKNVIRAFKLFDYNKDEHIRCYEVRRVLESYCFRMTDSQFERFCSRHRLSRTGAVNYKEFLQKLGICIEPYRKQVSESVAQALNWEASPQEQEKQPGYHRTVTEESAINLERLSMEEIDLALRKKVRANYQGLLKVFAAFDETKSGLISVEDLKAIFDNFVFPLSNEIFDGLMDRFNIKPTGKIAWKPFLLSLTESAAMENRWAIPMQQSDKSLQDETIPDTTDAPKSAPCRSEYHEMKFHVDPVRKIIEKSKTRDILQKLHKFLQERYPALKKNHKDIITRQELRRILQSVPLRLTDKQVKDLMLLLDPEHSGIVHYNQILDLAETDEEKMNQSYLNGATTVKKGIPEEAVWMTVEDLLRNKINQNWKDMQKALMKSDPERTGTISLAELRKILETYCFSISDQHFEKLCQQQQNNNIHVSYQQFLESLGMTDIPKIIGADVLQQQDRKRLAKQGNENLIRGNMMTVNEVKSELWQRIMNCDSVIRKSFLTHKKQSNGKINKEGFKKVLSDCEIIMDDHQFDVLADVLGFKNQDFNFSDFSKCFKGFTDDRMVKQCYGGAGDSNMKRMIADDCFNYIADKLKSTVLDLHSVFDRLDRNHDGLITMYDFRTLFDNCLLSTTEYHRFLGMVGLIPESKLSYLDFLQILKTIESIQSHHWNTSVHNCSSIYDKDCTLLACEQVHDFLAAKAKTGWFELSKAFKRVDSDGNLVVEKKDMRDILYQLCLPISTEQFEKLWYWYDSDKRGFITHLEFLKKLRNRFSRQIQTDSKQIVPESRGSLIDHSKKQQQFQTDGTQQQKPQTGNLNIAELKKQLKAKFRNHHKGFHEAFDKLDKRNDGCVSINDFQRVLKDHNYHLGEEQLKQLLVSLEIPMHNCKFSYSDFLRAIEDIENKSLKCGPKLTFIPREDFQIQSPEKMLTKLKGEVAKSSNALFKAFKSFDKYGNGKINSLAFRQVLHNVCFRLTDKEFNYLLSKLKLDSDYMVDWLDFLQSYNIYNYKAAEKPEGQDQASRPKSSQQLTMNEIMSHIREVVNSCLYIITQEFEEVDYANIKVVSKKHFKEIFFKHFMSLTDEQFENLWNHLPVNDFGNLDYHKFLNQFTGQQSVESQPKGNTSPHKPSTPGSGSRPASEPRRPKTSFSIHSDSKELAQQWASVTPSMNCEEIEQKLKKDVTKIWKAIEKECKEKDAEKRGEIDTKDFKAIMKKFCLIVKPEEFQQLAKKYDIKNTGRFAYNKFLRRVVLSLGPLDVNPPERMRIPHPKIPMSPGTEHEIFTDLMMRIQPCITKCWKLMRRTFKAYDDTGSGYISLFQFRQVLRQYGINITEEEFYYLSSYYDKHLKGTISYNEFLRAFL